MQQHESERTAGFTLIELCIVVTIIAIIAGIAIPNMLSSRSYANESAIVQTLRALATAQFQFVAAGALDQNKDGQPEFGTLGEMSSRQPLRGTSVLLSPRLITDSLGQLDANGRVTRHGYFIAPYMPAASGQGLAETSANIASIDPSLAANYWTCVAWPINQGQTGRLTMFINQQGQLVETKALYNGLTNVPPAGAALLGVAATHINSAQLACGVVGADGNLWTAVQ